jgi:hypothetical protein
MFRRNVSPAAALTPDVGRLSEFYRPSGIVLCHVDPLLSNGHDLSHYMTAVTRQRLVNSNRKTVFVRYPCRDVINRAS